MERKTKEISFGDNKAVIKTYITAHESQEIRRVYFSGAKIELVGDAPRVNDFNPAIQFDVENKMIQQLVVSLNGDTKDVLARALSLPADEYQLLIVELDALTSKKK